MENQEYSWKPPEEKIGNKQICKDCGNDSFRVYTNIIIDDARLYCSKCGKFWY
ncbi:MAG: hypothetical protein FD181_3455 [Prolixibacteraceae bacterium]|nr:MAG: hypothetical protein FD181_3455 [Prolixibacteraceae bacterium]